jgi:hypothetical protein
VGDVVISGTVGVQISPATVVINLAGNSFVDFAQEDTVTSWFTNIPGGLQAAVAADVSEGDTNITITVSGTPSVSNTQALAITIPADALTDTDSSITITPNPDARYDIFAIINNITDFQNFADAVNAGNTSMSVKFATGTRINVPDNAPYLPIGKTPATAYTGTFDGNNGLVNYTLTRSSSYLGLFGINNGTIRNFTVTGSVTADSTVDLDYVAGVAAYNDIGGTIQKVISQVIVTVTDDSVNTIHNIGGIAGFNGWDEYNTDSPHYNQAYQPGGTIIQCRNEGPVTGGFNKIGGIVGENAWQVIECVNTGDITCSKKTTNWPGVGGIAGRNGNNNTASEKGYILNCYNRGTVIDNTTERSSKRAYGGITGWCNDTSRIENCYTIGQFGQTYGPLSDEKNPIIGLADTTPPERGVNNYSLEGIYAYNPGNTVYTGIIEDEDYMKSAAFVQALKGPYVLVPGDYPKLAWE